MLEKKIPEVWEKNSNPNHITYTPLRSQKVVDPWVRFMSFTFFQQFLELVGPNNRTNITAKSDIKKMEKTKR